MSKLSSNQEKTLASLNKHSDDIYSLEYFNDYNLDYLLTKNPTSIVKIIKNARKILHHKIGFKTQKLPLGCSTFYCRNAKKEAVFARNFDYRVSPCLVLKTSPKNGYKSISICDLNFMLYGYKHQPTNKSKRLLYSPYMCMDGMNEKGLAISVLELNDKSTKQKTGKRKINTSLIIRYILDKCDSVDSAIEAFKSFDIYSSLGFNYHYQLVDKNKSVVIEYVKNELRIIPIEGNYQCLTNFYISKDGNNKKTHGQDRYETLCSELKNKNGTLKDEEFFPLLNKVNQYYKFRYKLVVSYYIETCYSAIYNLNKLEVSVSKHGQTFTFKLQ